MTQIAVLLIAAFLLVRCRPRLPRRKGDLPPPIPAAQQTWPSIALDPFAGGLSSPLHVTHAGDGSGRVFIVEQPGRIRIVKGQSLLGQPFLAIESRVLAGARGLERRFPPGYQVDGFFYPWFRPSAARRSCPGRRGIGQAAAIEQFLLTIPQPFPIITAGQLAFGPLDGYLYIGMGDGGSGGDPLNNAQNPDSLLGRSCGSTSNRGPSPTPSLPPIRSSAGLDIRQIWPRGLSKPLRVSFDRMTDLQIALVALEEVYFQRHLPEVHLLGSWKARTLQALLGCVAPGGLCASRG